MKCPVCTIDPEAARLAIAEARAEIMAAKATMDADVAWILDAFNDCRFTFWLMNQHLKIGAPDAAKKIRTLITMMAERLDVQDAPPKGPAKDGAP